MQQDVSYTSVGSNAGTPVEVTIDKADNNPNTKNEVHYLLDGFDADGNPKYEPKQARVNEVIASTPMDATAINVITSLASGGFGISGFTKTEIDGATHLVNKHGEVPTQTALAKALRFFVNEAGTINESLYKAPIYAENYANQTKLSWQIVRAVEMEFGKKLQQTGADKDQNVAAWATEVYDRIANMTVEERRKLHVDMHGEEITAKYYD